MIKIGKFTPKIWFT